MEVHLLPSLYAWSNLKKKLWGDQVYVMIWRLLISIQQLYSSIYFLFAWYGYPPSADTFNTPMGEKLWLAGIYSVKIGIVDFTTW